jgi:hypothetical protein
VYVVNNFEDVDSLANRKKVAEGTLEQAGYYTIDFSTAVSVEKGERFAIVLYLSTPGATHPLAIEYDAGDDSLASVDLTDGEGYISVNGTKFTDVDTLQECNLCIKAYTNERS